MVDTVDELRTGTGELELVLAITRETLVELIAVAQQLSGRFSLSDGELVYTYDEKTLRLAGSEELFSDLRVPIDAVLDLLNSDPAALLVLADSSQLVPLGTLDPAFRDVVMAAVLESDGIERGAAAATDTLRGHLDGIESPSLYFSVNLEQRTFANLFARVDAGVGSDIGHLPPLPDEDYVRGFDPTVFRVLDPDQPATPPTATDSSFSASEDQTITGDLSANDTLPNAGAIYALKGTPPQGGQLTINDDGTFTFVPNDGFAGEVTFTYTITDPAAGTTVEGEATLNITPVVDAPSIVPDLPVLTCQEDVPVSFSPVSINLEDTDGSETLSIRIEGVPAGASLSAGTQVSPGVWQVDPADFPTLTLTPPNDFNGSINLELIATSVETSTGETATTRRDLRIDLAAVADPAQVSAPTVTTNEDTQVNFGSSVTYNADDADGSEFVDMVAVTGVPAGANLSYTAQGAAIITVLPTGISIQGTEADIRATMNTLAITPGSQSGDDFTLQVAVTTRDAGGATNTITAGQTINVVPVADAPNATGGTFNTNEDTTVNLSGMSAGLVDVDGSETLSIVLSGVPAGATLNGGTALGGGRFALTPAELAALQFTPPANAHGTYSLSLEATATEAEGDTETTTVPVTINVAAQADAPNLTVGTTTTNEDVAAPFGTAIGFGLVDGDGSESVTSVRLTSVPANVTLNYSAAPGATVTAISGGFEITGTQAAIRTTLDSFTASNPTHGAIHFGIHVAVTTTDAGGSTATSNGTHQIDITPVADAPTVSSATTNVNEDTNVVFGDEITYSLVDADGSEAVTQVVVTGIPASATASYTATGGATVTAVSGGYQITGSPTAIRSTLDTLALTPGTNDDSDITLSVAVTTTDSNGDTATTNSSHTLAVSAVADAPTGSGSGSGTEDTTISTPVTIGLSDNDGSETIAQFQITAPTGATLDGFGPSGATVNNAGSVWTVTGTQTQITQALAAMTVTPPANSDVDFNLSVAITATETSPNGGQVATFSNTTTISVPVTLTADADAPTMTGGSFSTEEDTPVALSTLNVALADTDGSETITQIRITGVPTGASLSAGTQVSPGIWELSSAQLATVQFNPPANSHGTYNMTLSAITTEGSNSDTASASVPFSVTVDAQVDAATVTGGSTSTNEDVDVQFGNQISYTLGDTDGSENVTQVDITGLAGDVDMSYTAAGAAVVSSISGGYRITGTPTEIRATLNSFTYSPATHVGDDVNLTVDVTVEDADGSTRVDTATHVINVTPVVDTPSATGGTFGTNEDTAVPLTGIGGTLADTDGSEVATFSLSNVPAGASFATGTDAGGGVWTFTAAQMAAGLSFTPPAGASGTFDMTLTMTSTETGGTTATDTANVRVNVTGVADPATVTTGTTNATEDSNIPFGADITISGNDPDGSESFSVTLSGIPSAATAFWNNTLPGTVTANGGGSWTIAGTEAQVQALLASFGVTPDTHAASNFTVNVAVTTSEGTSTNTVNQNHIINFAQVADAPTVNAGTTTISEDVAGVFGTGITYALVDTDGSETISEVRVTGVPSGASISYTASGSASVTAVSGGYSITGTEAGIRATLNTFAYTTDTHDDAEVQLTVAVTSRDANGDTATTSSTHDLVVEARADEATITGSGSGNEDTTIAAGVTATLIDNDGSETITQAVVTAPAGITVSGFGPSGATVNQSGQQWTITGTPAEISAALAAMTATPPANSDANFQLSVAVTTTESAPNGGQVDLLNNTTVFNVPVTVVAVADAPTASGPASFSTEEDTAVSISALGGALTDIDGSETLSFRIESVPAGTSFSAGTNEGGGVWSFTESQLASLSLTPPDDWHGTINMQLIAVATEGSNSDTEETSRSFSVVVDAEADAPTVNGGSNSTNEDVDVLFGNQISYTLGDTDGSENVTQVDVTGLSGDAGMSYVASGAAVVTAISGGYRITGTPAEIRATLDTFTYSPATHVGDDVNLTVAVTVEDADGSTATQTGTHTIDITPVADSPTVSGDSVTTDEDVAVAVDLSGGLVDLDGSETISYQVTGVPAGASFSAGTDQGSGVWSFTTAQLSSLMFNPPAQAHGTYNMVLRATATEAEGDTATSTSPLVVNVNPILDPPVLNDGSTTANEDATILVGSDIDLTTVDVDGSQTMQITLSGIPAGSTVDWNTGLPGTVTPPAIAGGDYVISGTTPQALALLDTLTVQPPANTDDNFTIGVSVYAEEAGGANTTVTGNHQVIVEAVADAPNLTLAATSQGNEDTSIALPLTLSLNDTDGSETIQYVDIAGIPTGATLNVTSGGGVTTSSPATGTIRFTGSTADLIAKLASGISITPPLHSDVDIPLTITARATESNPTETEVDTLTADTVLNVTVQVDAVADGITAVGGSFATEEDTQVALSGLAGNGVDTDGSEVVTFRMLGVPSGASFASGTDAGGGVWTFTAAQVTAGLAFTPPANEHGTYNMTLEATTTEQNGGDNQVSTAAVTVVVDAEADRPTVNGTAVGNEDTTITFGNQFNVNLVDNDGSETLTQLVVTMPGTETATYTAQGGASVVVSGQDYTITGTQTDIQATLDTFAWTPPTHSDDNIIVGISATTQDADGSTATRNSNRTIRVRAVADEPGGSASSISGTEDTPITLDINVTASADTDGSESYSVRLFDIPDGSIVAGSTTNGVTYTQSGSDWIVAAPTLAALNTALSSATYRPPTDFSGTINAQVEIISTEGATGNEVAVQTASVTRPFDIEINQVADAPELRVVDATAGAAGLEDTPIRLQVDVRLADDDGSEVLSDVTISNIPAGARITNAAGVTLGTDLGGGEVRVTSAQLAQLHVIAPPNSNDNFQLTISASSEESNQGLTGDGDTEIGTATIDVAVIGVADPANITPSPISVAEDTTIPLGTAVGASLADADGSESLFFVIEGLPAGITPSAGSFIGGRWQVDAADMPTLTIPGRPNFSGDYVADYATGLRVLAVTQEDDGHQTTVQVPLSITVTPVVDAQTWSPSVTVTEGNDIPLSSVAPGGLIDGDGSEEIVSYTFNLNSLISDAGIAVSGGTTQNFIDNHINGTFTDNGNGTITVSAANLPGVSFDAAAFTDSNRDFTVPVDVLFTDGAASQTVSRTFSVNLVGDADTPTVFANNVSGNDNTPLALSLGGTTTDTDAAQGQAVSESIYYIVSGFADPGADVLLTDAAGDPIGFNNQDGTWVLQPSDLANLHIMGIRGTGGSKTLTVTTIATENDGDVAMNSTTFTVSITNTGGPGSPQAPLPPVVTINPMTVDEDGTIALDADIQSNPGDPTTGLDDVTVVISNVPAGVTVQGAIFNNVTGSWVSNAANVNAGNVTFTPVGDFSGTITPTVTAIATNGNQLTASNANNPAPITVTAVADPASISVSGSGNEDSAIALNISVTSQDTDGSETLVEPIRVTISAGTLSAGTDVGGGVWELTEAELSGLTLTPPANSDADISVSVQATMREPNGDTETATQAATVTVAAVADQAALTVSNASGNEDAAIALTGLSAALVDTDGSETLSTTITGVPEGSILSAGANNGDGSWTIAPGDLAGLSITPPMNWSGTMNLQLVGFTLEDSGATSQISQAFTVTVVPQADPVVFAALPQTAAAGASVNLGLNLQPGDATGTGPGENPAETVTVNLQASTDFVASVTGGTLTRVAAGHWRFTGTAAQGNTLAVQAFGEARDIDITVGVNATDGASVGAVTSVTLPLEVTGSASTLTGDGTANTLSGGAGADLIIGGGGSDALTGGLGADLFVWKAGDTSGGAVDTISDFNASEDVLDLGDLIPSYDPATDAVADYITLVENAGNTTIRIDTTGSGTHSTDVVELTGETGLDLATLITSGALVP